MIDPTEAEQLAISFLMAEWDIPEEGKECFTILGTRLVTDMWYIVEIGVEGLPDKWAIQADDTGYSDPNYSFISPIHAADGTADLTQLPESIAQAIASEHSNA
ncbi:hypothetical protein [Allocoleopsis sp.]|uniref:hypothetical protein n=1 Tax=Allocoleopsis sp. TaxID=3088169 RepID=UPI002FCEA63C